MAFSIWPSAIAATALKTCYRINGLPTQVIGLLADIAHNGDDGSSGPKQTVGIILSYLLPLFFTRLSYNMA